MAPIFLVLQMAFELLPYPLFSSELIKKYQAKAKDCEVYRRQLREAQAKVSTLEQGMVGLKAEMQTLHEVRPHLWRKLMKSLSRVVTFV